MVDLNRSQVKRLYRSVSVCIICIALYRLYQLYCAVSVCIDRDVCISCIRLYQTVSDCTSCIRRTSIVVLYQCCISRWLTLRACIFCITVCIICIAICILCIAVCILCIAICIICIAICILCIDVCILSVLSVLGRRLVFCIFCIAALRTYCGRTIYLDELLSSLWTSDLPIIYKFADIDQFPLHQADIYIPSIFYKLLIISAVNCEHSIISYDITDIINISNIININDKVHAYYISTYYMYQWYY